MRFTETSFVDSYYLAHLLGRRVTVLEKDKPVNLFLGPQNNSSNLTCTALFLHVSIRVHMWQLKLKPKRFIFSVTCARRKIDLNLDHSARPTSPSRRSLSSLSRHCQLHQSISTPPLLSSSSLDHVLALPPPPPPPPPPQELSHAEKTTLCHHNVMLIEGGAPRSAAAALLARGRRSSEPSGRRTDGGIGIGKGTIENRHRVGAGRKDIHISYASRVHDTRRGPATDR